MDFWGNIPLLLLLLMTGAGAILVKDLIGAVLILGSYSFFLALAWAWLGAVEGGTNQLAQVVELRGAERRERLRGR